MVKEIKTIRINHAIDIILNNMQKHDGYNRYNIRGKILTTIFDHGDYVNLFMCDIYNETCIIRSDDVDDIIKHKIKKKLGKDDNCKINIKEW